MKRAKGRFEDNREKEARHQEMAARNVTVPTGHDS